MRRDPARSARTAPWVLLAFGVVLWAWGGSATASERVALVVGNGGYNRISKLINPVNDATLMARTLEGLGFRVSLVIDADREAMNRSIKTFGRRLARGRDEAVGLFYYAGHGVEAGGRNYLIPLNAEIGSETELKSDAVPAEWILSWMEEAGNRLNMVILDACRNNPYGDTFRSGSRGLGRVDAPSGSLIAYSAAPGKVATDGKGDNSPYTAALAVAMTEPGLKLEDVFKRVRVAVERETHRQQTPWESSSLTGDFYFVPPSATDAGAGGAQAKVGAQDTSASESASGSTTPADSPAPGGSASDRLTAEQLAAKRLAAEIELLFWDSVKDSSDAADIQAYLDQYPGGTYGVLARNRLKRMERASGAVSLPEPADAVDTTETLAQASAELAEPVESAAAPPAEPAEIPTRPPTVQAMESSLGLERSERRRIQSGLASLGFDPGPSDGLFGRVTRGAMRKVAVLARRGGDGVSRCGIGQVPAGDGRRRGIRAGEVVGNREVVRGVREGVFPAGRFVAEARRLQIGSRGRPNALASDRKPGRRIRDCAACPDLGGRAGGIVPNGIAPFRGGTVRR